MGKPPPVSLGGRVWALLAPKVFCPSHCGWTMALVPGGYLEGGRPSPACPPPLWLWTIPARCTDCVAQNRYIPPSSLALIITVPVPLSSAPLRFPSISSHTPPFFFLFFVARFLHCHISHWYHPLYFPSRGLSLFLGCAPLHVHPSRDQHPQRGVKVTGSLTVSLLQAANPPL